MSLKGSATPNQILVGRINRLNLLTISAYGIAVKNGFEGTEEEWLESLKMSHNEVEDAVEKYLTENPVAIDKTLSITGQAADAKVTGNAINEVKGQVKSHTESKANPHGVTKSQLGLGNVDNTSDANKPVSNAQATAIAAAKKAGTDAQTTANNAQTLANDAYTTANSAQAAAIAAQTRAENAETNAKTYAKDYADSRHINGEVTLTPSGWSNNTQTVSFPGVTSDTSKTDIYASPAPADDNYTAYVENGVRPYSQGDGTITFKCEDVPSVNVYVNVSVEFVGIIPDLGDLAMWEGGRY